MHVNDVDVGEGAREFPPDSWVEPDRCCRTIHGEDGGATEQDRAGRALVSRPDDDGIVTYVAQPTGEPDGDHRAVADGFVSVSPLQANLTHDPSLATLADWRLELD